MSKEVKLAVVNKLRQKYSISAICRVLGINRSIIYYQHQLKEKLLDTGLEDKIKRIFIDNRKAYGTRKINKLPRDRALNRLSGACQVYSFHS